MPKAKNPRTWAYWFIVRGCVETTSSTGPFDRYATALLDACDKILVSKEIDFHPEYDQVQVLGLYGAKTEPPLVGIHDYEDLQRFLQDVTRFPVEGEHHEN